MYIHIYVCVYLSIYIRGYSIYTVDDYQHLKISMLERKDESRFEDMIYICNRDQD